MLVYFKIKNFLSFDDEQIFSMKAGKHRNNVDRLYKDGSIKLLKFMSIYGANSSGKSNFVSAFAFFHSIVLAGLDKSTYPFYCKIDDKNKTKESLFELSIIINKRMYVYGFEIILDTASIIREYMYEKQKNGICKTIFDRNTKTGMYSIGNFFTSKKEIDRLRLYCEDIKTDDSILFLKMMNTNKTSLYKISSKIGIIKAFFDWMKYKLDVTSPESIITNFSLLNDSDTLKQIANKLNSYATGIEKFEILNVPRDKVVSELPKELLNSIQKTLSDNKKTNQETNKTTNPAVMLRSPYNDIYIIELDSNNEYIYKTLAFKHSNSQATFSLSEESDGTIRLFDIIEVLLNNNDNKVYIIDEINRTFHPMLTLKFISDFLEIAKSKNIQLIVTTHESQLMNLKILRKDEISFVDRSSTGCSTIYSLDNYDDRFDKKIITQYFNGKYNAVPTFI